jgi:hypothetical protein
MCLKPPREFTTMINHLLTRLSRWSPDEPPRDDVHPSVHDDDSSWHGSSFELARGLEVIEHRGMAGTVFADARPPLHPPEASSAI